MQSKRKKMVIVFPPVTMPTSPPLGPAILKHFIERQLPDWQVQVMDLNVWLFDRLLNGLAAGECRLDPQSGPRPEETAALGEMVMSAPVYRKELDHYGRPDFSDLDLASYYSPEPVIPLLRARGCCCWRRCAFCVHHLSAGLTYSPHSVAMVIKMLDECAGQGIRNFSLIDEMLEPRRFAQLARAIIDHGLDISCYALVRPSRLFTPEILADMARSGCKYLLWGVESGCQEDP